jgi:hypothetical protein
MAQEANRESLLETLRASDEFAKVQELLSEALSVGHFRLAQARHGAQRVSVLDSRFEIDAAVEVEVEDAGTRLLRREVDVDPLLLVSALPSPHLRSAQIAFAKALDHAVSLAQLARRVSKTTHPR